MSREDQYVTGTSVSMRPVSFHGDATKSVFLLFVLTATII